MSDCNTYMADSCDREFCPYLTGIKGRFILLVNKLISFKFVIYLMTAGLVCAGFISQREYLAVTIAVLFGHVGLKGFYSYMDQALPKAL